MRSELPREEKPCDARSDGEHEHLDENLRDDAATRRAQRVASGELLPAGDRPGVDEDGDVRAWWDEEQRHEEQDDAADPSAGVTAVEQSGDERHDAWRGVDDRPRRAIGRQHPDGRYLGTGSLDCGAGGEPREDEDLARAFRLHRSILAERCPDLIVDGERVRSGHNPDDGVERTRKIAAWV